MPISDSTSRSENRVDDSISAGSTLVSAATDEMKTSETLLVIDVLDDGMWFNEFEESSLSSSLSSIRNGILQSSQDDSINTLTATLAISTIIEVFAQACG